MHAVTTYKVCLENYAHIWQAFHKPVKPFNVGCMFLNVTSKSRCGIAALDTIVKSTRKSFWRCVSNVLMILSSADWTLNPIGWQEYADNEQDHSLG